MDLAAEGRHLGDAGARVIRIAGSLGVIGLVAGGLTAYQDPAATSRFFHAYLTAFCFFLSLALGALFFVMLQHLTRSGWSVVVRRLAECIAANIPLLAMLALPLLAGLLSGHLYHWADSDSLTRDHLLAHKRPYLNVSFFIIRLFIYFAVWAALARFFFRWSVRQDATGDTALTLRMQRFSGPAMVLFTLTITFAAFDLLMSLDPHWYSTIFGVYYFSGGVVGFFALLAMTVFSLQRAGRLTEAVTAEHYHDLGKLIFAFVVFWVYIAFSQHMLIWYANIPEETVWYLRRQSGEWAGVGLLLLFGHFVVPFLALIARWPKRRPLLLALVGLWVLAMHWLDIYWLVMPQVSPDVARPQLVDVACLVGIGGVLTTTTVRRMARQSLLPERDPRLGESLAFENV